MAVTPASDVVAPLPPFAYRDEKFDRLLEHYPMRLRLAPPSTRITLRNRTAVEVVGNFFKRRDKKNMPHRDTIQRQVRKWLNEWCRAGELTPEALLQIEWLIPRLTAEQRLRRPDRPWHGSPVQIAAFVDLESARAVHFSPMHVKLRTS
jgi:hypothetical protein